MTPPTSKPRDYRFEALWRFGLAISLLNLLGHTLFGFEQSWAQPVAALLTAYVLEILFESVIAWSSGVRPRYLGGGRALLSFLLPAHITGLAIAMLLYSNDQLRPIIFATAVAISSKVIFRVAGPRGSRHFLNPSNFGITVTLLLFPWVGIAPPYHFTENLSGWMDWLLPLVIICSGSFLNLKFTRKAPLIGGWLLGFVLQALVRAFFLPISLANALLPMTGVAFLLFTFYMVSDPGTTPHHPWRQVAFGMSVAALYGLLMVTHVVFGLFFALSLVCLVRGLALLVESWRVGAVDPTLAPPSMARRVP